MYIGLVLFFYSCVQNLTTQDCDGPGALKPEKCFYYMVDYKWLDDGGSWQYGKMVDVPQLTVPLTDGNDATIKQLPVDESTNTLGIWTNPAGECQKQLDIFYDVMDKWTNRLSAGKLPARWAWVSYFHQLWAKGKTPLWFMYQCLPSQNTGQG